MISLFSVETTDVDIFLICRQFDPKKLLFVTDFFLSLIYSFSVFENLYQILLLNKSHPTKKYVLLLKL